MRKRLGEVINRKNTRSANTMCKSWHIRVSTYILPNSNILENINSCVHKYVCEEGKQETVISLHALNFHKSNPWDSSIVLITLMFY